MMRSSKCRVLIAASSFLTIMAFAVLLFGLYFHHIRHSQLWLAYSPSLPDYVPHFLGREKEISELVMMLDPENTDVRTVSIVGPPGFGKSSLAIHVGHEMIDRGVVVNYVNLDEVTLDGLPEKIVGNAGIITKNDSVDRLIKWVNDFGYSVVIILDNCDVVLHKRRDDFQSLLEHVRKSATSRVIKFILTSKQKMNFVHEFEEYTLEEISFEASCKLLGQMAKLDIGEKTCRAITELTGSVPLALKVVGAILRTRTKNVTRVIKKLKRELLQTLNPADMDQKVNASISLSYMYLSKRQKKLGRYLALFPGSFSFHDACKILPEVTNCDCDTIEKEIEVLDQRSLVQALGRDRYQFHKIIKEFFSVIKRSNDGEVNSNAFREKFQSHYERVLYHLSVKFEKEYASALHTLDNEKHNIQYLLYHINDVCLLNPELSMRVFETVQIALEKNFLTCRFTAKELRIPLRSICRCAVRIMRTTPGVNIHPVKFSIDTTAKGSVLRLMSVLAEMALQWHRLVHHVNATAALKPLESVKWLLELMEGVIDVPTADDLYYVLGSYYHALGELDKEKRCHEKILRRANAQLHNCLPGFCDYHSIAKAYYLLNNYERGAHFLELDLKHNEDSMSRFVLADTLKSLYTCQVSVRSYTKAIETLNRLVHLLPLLIDATLPDVYSNLELLSGIASIFRANGRIDEAKQLERKQIMAIKEMNSSETHREESFALQAATLAATLFEAKQYGDVPELAECALNILQKQGHFPQKVVELEFIIGKAEYYNGKKNASIGRLKMVARNVVYEHLPFHGMARKACQYMIAQSHWDAACLLIVWNDLKDYGYIIVMNFVFADIFPTYTSPNEHIKTFSTDIAPSSAYLDILPSELATPVMFLHAVLNWLMQTVKNSIFYIANVVLNIGFLFRVIKFALIPLRFIILLRIIYFCCYHSVYYTYTLIRSIFRKYIYFLKTVVYVILRKCIQIL